VLFIFLFWKVGCRFSSLQLEGVLGLSILRWPSMEVHMLKQRESKNIKHGKERSYALPPSPSISHDLICRRISSNNYNCHNSH
ncbi:hypothetical protein HAX54_012318, partial [Datura stramonium]|nr:hypothetical protein [Datura stramonium]